MLPRRHESALCRDVPGTGECVLLDPDRGRILALNALGAALWELLDGSRGPEELSRIVADASGEPLEVVRRDVSGLLARLESEGFLRS